MAKKAKKPTAKKKNPGGRPVKYKVAYAKQAFRHCLLGATDKELAELFEVTEKTINLWKHKYPKFLQSVKEGKTDADAKVAESMFKRAIGYEHPEDKIFCTNGAVTVQPTIKHYPPDGPTCMNWLKNRQPGKFRDKTDHEITGKDGKPLAAPTLVIHMPEGKSD